jgi:hypothetical protein
MGIVSRQITYKTAGQWLTDKIFNRKKALGSVARDVTDNDLNVRSTLEDQAQAKDIFQKHHIQDIGHNEFDPQRDYMYQLYIYDIPGTYWVDMVNNYPSFMNRVATLGYAISVGSIKTATIRGLIDIIGNAGVTGDSSPQQSLAYRVNSVKLPTRTVQSVETKFLNRKMNIPIGTQQDGTLSVNFTETEDAFILRQFNSWLSIEDQNAIFDVQDSVGFKTLKNKTRAEEEIINGVAALQYMKGGSNVKRGKKIAEGVRQTKELLNNVRDFVGNSGFDGYAINEQMMPMTKLMKTDISLMMYRYNGDDIGYKIHFYGCFPKSIGNANFSYESSGNTISYEVEFEYDYYKIEYISEPNRLIPTNNAMSKIAMLQDETAQMLITGAFQRVHALQLKRARYDYINKITKSDDSRNSEANLEKQKKQFETLTNKLAVSAESNLEIKVANTSKDYNPDYISDINSKLHNESKEANQVALDDLGFVIGSKPSEDYNSEYINEITDELQPKAARASWVNNGFVGNPNKTINESEDYNPEYINSITEKIYGEAQNASQLFTDDEGFSTGVKLSDDFNGEYISDITKDIQASAARASWVNNNFVANPNKTINESEDYNPEYINSINEKLHSEAQNAINITTDDLGFITGSKPSEDYNPEYINEINSELLSKAKNASNITTDDLGFITGSKPSEDYNPEYINEIVPTDSSNGYNLINENQRGLFSALENLKSKIEA